MGDYDGESNKEQEKFGFGGLTPKLGGGGNFGYWQTHGTA